MESLLLKCRFCEHPLDLNPLQVVKHILENHLMKDVDRQYPCAICRYAAKDKAALKSHTITCLMNPVKTISRYEHWDSTQSVPHSRTKVVIPPLPECPDEIKELIQRIENLEAIVYGGVPNERDSLHSFRQSKVEHRPSPSVAPTAPLPLPLPSSPDLPRAEV